MTVATLQKLGMKKTSSCSGKKTINQRACFDIEDHGKRQAPARFERNADGTLFNDFCTIYYTWSPGFDNYLSDQPGFAFTGIYKIRILLKCIKKESMMINWKRLLHFISVILILNSL